MLITALWSLYEIICMQTYHIPMTWWKTSRMTQKQEPSSKEINVHLLDIKASLNTITGLYYILHKAHNNKIASQQMFIPTLMQTISLIELRGF